MNIYWCYERGNWGGLFVVAKTRGRAKEIFSAEVDCEYTEVRTNIYRRGVCEITEDVIDEGSPLLEKYGLEYAEEEEE